MEVLTVPNGVIDLATGEFWSRDFSFTAEAGVPWLGLDCPAPRWEQFIHEIMDGDVSAGARLQQLLGSALRGQDSRFIILGGAGLNGKSLLLNVLHYILGQSMASVADASSLLRARENHRVSDFRLVRARLYSVIHDGDRLKVRWPQPRPVIIHTNAPEAIKFKRWIGIGVRVEPIAFPVRFVAAPQRSNERPRDPNLKAALIPEASGILAWLVRGGITPAVRPPAPESLATDSCAENGTGLRPD